jgi:Chitin synthase
MLGLIGCHFLQMGCYQEGVAKDTVNGKDVQAHIFE